MEKEYIVCLSDAERATAQEVVHRLNGSSQKVRRAQVLLQADTAGPAWTDTQIAQAYRCRTKTVENIRQRLVERGFSACLEGGKRAAPPRDKLLDGRQEAQIIATRLGTPAPGHAKWSLRLLARKVVELGIVEQVSHETVRSTLKKTR